MSDTPKHTPGPWEALPYTGAGEFGSYAILPCDLRLRSVNPDIAAVEQKADAELIAAAPEMLQALKALLSECWGGCACTDPSEQENAAWDLAKAAVDKAEGGQQ
jgi:hypothetical protein